MTLSVDSVSIPLLAFIRNPTGPRQYQITLEVESTSMPMTVLRKIQAPPPSTVVTKLGDPGFEQFQVTDPSGFQFPPGGATPWVGCKLSKNGSAFTSGNPNAPEGNQVAILQGTSSFYQDFPITAGSHTVTIAAAQRGNISQSPQVVQVSIDGVAAGTIQPAGTSYQDYSPNAFTISNSGTHRLGLAGLATTDSTAFLDNVRLDAPVTPPGNLGATNQRTGVFYAGSTGQAIKNATNAALAGDIILVNPGTYDASATNVFILVSGVTLRSAVAGQKWIVDVGGQNQPAVIGDNGVSFTVEDAELRNNKVANIGLIHGQAGPQNIVVRRCFLHDGAHGIKIGTYPNSSLLVENTEFLNNGTGDVLVHDIYADNIDSVTVRGCYFHRSTTQAWGHHVKSRARVTLIEANRITMEFGNANRCVDLPSGGDATLRGNLLELNVGNLQNISAGVVSNNMVNFGTEENPHTGLSADWPINRLTCVQNTFVNHQAPPAAGSVWIFKLDPYLQGEGGLPANEIGAANWIIKDNVFAGFSKQDYGLGSTYVWTIYAGGNVAPLPTYEISTTDNTIITSANMTAQMPNHAGPTFDFSLATPVNGSQNWAPLSYVHPTQTTVRADTYRGGVPYGVGTLVNGQWTPPVGTIPDAAWAALPLYEVVEWMGTNLSGPGGQLQPPYGIVSPKTFTEWGNTGIAAHFSSWGGMAFDDATGRFWGYGGGHADSSNNMLSCFDARTGKWSVAITPTANEYMPSNYKVQGGQPGYTFTLVVYPEGGADNFMPSETPPGDGKTPAQHIYCGMAFCNGELVKIRGGGGQWNEQGFRYWQTSGGITAWTKGGPAVRNVNGVEQHAVYYNGILYWGMEAGQVSDNKYWTVSQYDPVAKAEIAPFNVGNPGFNLDGFTFFKPNGDWFIAAHGGSPPTYTVSNVGTGASLGSGTLTGRVPAVTGSGFDAAWVPDINKAILLNGQATSGGAGLREWVAVDTNGVCTTSVITDHNNKTPDWPTDSKTFGNRIRYWSAKKVLIIHPQTSLNARVIRMG